jgi:UDPglucose 6-dehydrogenase
MEPLNSESRNRAVKVDSHTRNKTKVCILGLWHLGSVYSACLADLGYAVTGWDDDAKKVAELNKGIPPLFEPGLQELIIKNLSSENLVYVTDLEHALRGASYVLMTIDTPVDIQDKVNLSPILEISSMLAQYLEQNSTLIVSSQVSIGTCDQIKSLIKQQNPYLEFDIAYCPENLRLGQAIECFKKPEMVVIGTDNPSTLQRVQEFWAPIHAPKVNMSLKSAEMTKHALNAFLGTCISFINEIANLCDELGADALDVVSALHLDKRIGKKAPLKPGLGFAGGTLARDLRILQNLGDELSLETHFIDAILRVNEEQNKIIVKKLERIYGKLDDLTVGILGLTYKPGTSTLRRSAAIEIIHELVNKGIAIKAYDPEACLEEIHEHLEFQFCRDPYEVARGSDALIILTDWPQFKTLDFELIKSKMNKPVLIDARNILDEEDLAKKGFLYLGIGRGS